MPNPVTTLPLRATAPTGSPPAGRTAAAEPGFEDRNFADALERRMSGESRPDARSESPAARAERAAGPREAAPRRDTGQREAAATRSQDPAAQTPADARPERTEAATADEPTPDTGATEDRDDTDIVADPALSPASGTPVAALPTSPTVPSTPASAATPSDAVAALAQGVAAGPAAAADPGAAASLAGLLPNVAALPAAPAADAGLPTSDELLAASERKPGAALLERLIAESTAGRSSADGTTGLAAADTEKPFAIELDAAASPSPGWKLDAEPGPLEAAAAKPGATPNVAAGPCAGVPAEALQLQQADPQAAGLHVAGFASHGRTEQAAAPQLPVQTPVGQPGWADEVGNRVTWLVGRGEMKAELQLTPPQLGRLEVSIQINGDQTVANFVAATASARDALEQALPRLREMLQQAGISLGQANVSTSGDQRAGRDDAPGRGAGGRSAGSPRIDGIAAGAASSGWVRAGSGLVDTFA